MCFHMTWTAAGVFSKDLVFAKKKCIHFKEDVVVSVTLFFKKEKRMKCKLQIKEKKHTIL